MSKITLEKLQQMYHEGEKIVCTTAYDASFAQSLEEYGIELFLIGDSLGKVIQGHHSTIPVSLADMVYHTQCVCRGSHKAHIMADMPFLTYTSVDRTLDCAGALIQAGADMVKLEGGAQFAKHVTALTEFGMPVCAHLGVTPQYSRLLGKQFADKMDAETLLKDALTLQKAGAVMLILVGVDSLTTKNITAQLTIPVIGIGSGPYCSGQIQVIYNMLGLTSFLNLPERQTFKLTNQTSIKTFITDYVSAVKKGKFPAEK